MLVTIRNYPRCPHRFAIRRAYRNFDGRLCIWDKGCEREVAEALYTYDIQSLWPWRKRQGATALTTI